MRCPTCHADILLFYLHCAGREQQLKILGPLQITSGGASPSLSSSSSSSSSSSFSFQGLGPWLFSNSESQLFLGHVTFFVPLGFYSKAILGILDTPILSKYSPPPSHAIFDVLNYGNKVYMQTMKYREIIEIQIIIIIIIITIIIKNIIEIILGILSSQDIL